MWPDQTREGMDWLRLIDAWPQVADEPRRRLFAQPARVARTFGLVAAVLASPGGFAPADAQTTPASGKVTPVLSVRARLESWNGFGDAAGDDYVYGHALLRAGLQQQRPTFGWRVEFAAPVVFGAPDDATQGHGASYYRANGSERTIAQFFPKQVYLRFGREPEGHHLRAGRFEFSETSEVTPADPTLAAAKRRSVMQRLIGPFLFTQGARSLDAVEYGWTGDGLNVTLLGALPTVGVFNLDGWGHVAEMPVGYAAVTGQGPWSRERSEWRVFAVGFRDDRGLVKADNRPQAVREADREPIEVATLGAHLLQVIPTSAGPVDMALWGAGQFGDWGTLRHRAWATDFEIGWQPKDVAWRPWLRLGLFASSGDADSLDATHGTWFQNLATPRIYARFPFYNLTSVRDWSASVMLRPSSRLTLRADVRALQIGDAADGWYAGSGPYDEQTFGISYRPSGGSRDLGTLIDLSADLQLSPRWTLSAYGGVAPSGDVIRASAPSGSAGSFAILELEYRR